MANTPISSGFKPVFFTASRRARMAASSMGRMLVVMWGSRSGNRVRMSRRTAGQAEEITGRSCSTTTSGCFCT